METYLGDIDDVPTANSDNLVKSGGLYPLLFTLKSMSSIVTIQKAYIDSSGNANNTGSAHYNFDILIYDVTGISEVAVKGNEVGYNFMHYAFYSSTQISSETLIQLGTSAHNTTSAYYIEESATVPEGATHLAITRYKDTSPLLATFKIDDLSERVLSLESDVTEINNVLYVEKYTTLTYDSLISNKYINNSGGLTDFNYFTIYKYLISSEITRLRITNTLRVGVGHIYAFYDENDTLLKLGVKGSDSTHDIYIEDVPEGTSYIYVQIYQNSQFLVENIENITVGQEIQNLKSEIYDVQSSCNVGKISYSFDGENLYAAYLTQNEEITYWFKKCMANQLYTFYRVGYRLTDRKIPSCNGIASEYGITIINATSSDNIGPFSMSNGGWVGGNHHYPDESVNPKYLTAKTDTYAVYIDGRELTEAGEGYAESIVVEVQNTIYDPAISPEESTTILSTPLCTEYATYVINKNTIEVSLRHKFSSTTTNAISNYYGMQSMFSDEQYIMTPNGQYVNWESAPSSVDFSKNSYPNFNRYLEKSSTKQSYQSSYLYPSFGLGNHSKISDSAFIFKRSSGKCYHHLISSGTITPIAGETIQWGGSYTFFHTPLIDDEYVFAYQGTVRGHSVLFINTKQAFEGTVPVPKDLSLKKISIIENYGITDGDGSTDFNLGANGVYIASSGTGSLILEIL